MRNLNILLRSGVIEYDTTDDVYRTTKEGKVFMNKHKSLQLI